MEIQFKSNTLEDLIQELQSVSMERQLELSQKIQEASLNGNMAAIAELTAAITQMQTDLQAAYQKKLSRFKIE